MGLTNLEAEGDKPLSSKFSVWEPHQVTDTPLGGMEKVMIEGRGIPVDLLERKEEKKRAKWNLATLITILWEKMGKGSWRLFTAGYNGPLFLLRSLPRPKQLSWGRQSQNPLAFGRCKAKCRKPRWISAQPGREIIAGLSPGRSYSSL